MRNQVDSIRRSAWTEHLDERMRPNLRELVLHIVGVHRLDLVARRGTQYLDDLDELINARLAREEWLAEHELCHDTSSRPHVNVGGVVCRTKDEFGCAVVSRANVRDVWLVLHQDLGRAKVAELEDSGVGVEKEVLGLDVAVTDADRVDVCQGSQELVHVQLDLEHWDNLLELGVVPKGAVDGFGDKLEHKVEVDLVLLVAVRVEECLEVDNVGVGYQAHDLQLAVLESLVLQHLFDRNLLFWDLGSVCHPGC